jgi:long-chain acyl-CoA synthetase
MYAAGGSIGFFSGNVKELKNDIKILRPTVFPTVPRVLNRVHDAVVDKMNRNAVTRFMLRKALAAKQHSIDQ